MKSRRCDGDIFQDVAVQALAANEKLSKQMLFEKVQAYKETESSEVYLWSVLTLVICVVLDDRALVLVGHISIPGGLPYFTVGAPDRLGT
jgi:hypothetical protein